MIRVVYGCLLALAMCGCQRSFDEQLAEEARAYTEKHCPQRLDDYTMLDSTVYDLQNRTYKNYLTLGRETPPTLLDNLPLVRQSLIRDLQDNPNWNSARERGVRFEYIYRMERDGSRFSVLLGPEDYGA